MNVRIVYYKLQPDGTWAEFGRYHGVSDVKHAERLVQVHQLSDKDSAWKFVIEVNEDGQWVPVMEAHSSEAPEWAKYYRKAAGQEPGAAIVENEFRILVLERLIDRLIAKMPVLGGPPVSASELEELRRGAAEELRRKYPGMKLRLKDGGGQD